MSQQNLIHLLLGSIERLPLVHRLGLRLIGGIAVSLICLFVFVNIADSVLEQETLTRFDLLLSDELHARGTPGSISAYRFISWWGMEGATLIGVAVSVYFIVRRQWLSLMVWVGGVVGGLVLNNVLKFVFLRPRPVFIDPFVTALGFSFPSGHTMQATVVYGLLGAFLWTRLRYPVLRILLVFFLVLVIILVGISRITLGAHFFSDVVGGMAAGGVWLTVCITTLDTLNRRKQRAPAASEAQLSSTRTA